VSSADHPRWHNYVLQSGEELAESWKAQLDGKGKRVLFLLGKGFDPRMCRGLELLSKLGYAKKCDVLAITFDEGPQSPSQAHGAEVEKNWESLVQLVGKGSLSTRPVKVWSDDGRRVGARNAASLITKLEEVEQYSDIVVDISAMPRGIYFPLISKLLYLLDKGQAEKRKHRPNLHILVTENSELDRRIVDQGIDESAGYVHPFGGGIEREATTGTPSVWIPILGENQETQLKRIHELLNPDEICPLLPSPALDPRRADNLLLEYRGLLFDQLRVEPRNLIYAAERNPFEVYRQIRKVLLHYADALRPLGMCKAVLSALSTKLLSLGALLAAYELKYDQVAGYETQLEVGIAHVDCQGYALKDEAAGARLESDGETYGLWLAGECDED
jgi:hypothetical protein